MYKRKLKAAFGILFVTLCISLGITLYKKKQSAKGKVLHTVYGDFPVTEPVLLDLLEAPSVTRLKKINQYGAHYYVWKQQHYTRYDHSVGVMVLLRKNGADLLEQIAGLLHDVSHTVFSHVGDHVFAEKNKKKEFEQNKDAYQDMKHAWFLKQTEIVDILKKYDISVDDVLHKSGKFHMLEQSLPDVCADRFEYNLYGGYIENLLTQKEIEKIVQSAHFENGSWYFDSIDAAKMFARTSIYLTENIFGSPWNAVVNTFAADALLRAVDIGLISMEEIHFSTDECVWERMSKSDDPELQRMMKKLNQYNENYCLSDTGNYDLCLCAKFRGVNPLVKTDAAIKRLTEVDAEFAQEYAQASERVCQKKFIKFTV